jgi:hypothetical protein
MMEISDGDQPRFWQWPICVYNMSQQSYTLCIRSVIFRYYFVRHKGLYLSADIFHFTARASSSPAAVPKTWRGYLRN